MQVAVNIPSEQFTTLFYDYERKRKRKVRKYKDKKGFIKIEYEECLKWIEELCKKEKVIEDSRAILNANFYALKNKHKFYELKRGKYLPSKLNTVLFDNRCRMDKVGKLNSFVKYKRNDVYELLVLLHYAKSQGVIKDFLDVPDVFFAVRQLKGTGVEIYFY